MAYSSFKRPASLKACALLVSVLALTPAAAFAGFEWKGPISPPMAPAETPPSAPAPAIDTNSMQGLEPVIQWNGAPAAVPAMPAAPPVAVEKLPVEADTSDVIQGFAANIPLVIALQQIVPPGFRYSFAPGTNPGDSVSWSGGKPWKTVLSDMLAAHNLSYKIEANTVVVGHFETPVKEAFEAPVKPAPETLKPAAVASPPAAPAISWMPTPAPAPVPPPAPKAPAITWAPAPVAPPPVAKEAPRVLLGKASPSGMVEPQITTTTTTTTETAPVDLRRRKPSSILGNLGWTHDDTASATSNSWDHAAPVPAAAPPMQPVPPPAVEAVAVPEAPKPVPVAAAAPVPLQKMADAASSATLPAWRGAKDQTLRTVLKQWSDTAGVELYWSIDYDYKLDSDVAIPGTYDEAVGKLLDRFAKIRPQPYGQLHQSDKGPRVLVVKSYDVAG